MKYHNGELKSINDKITKLHEREINMLQKESVGGQQLRDLEERERAMGRERDRVEKQLAEVARVAGEMEAYYMG